jgi:S-formylglutathione hydrolase FrmB
LLHGHGPVVAFPAGGVHGYWHNRADGEWDTWVSEEVIPRVVKRFGVDPRRIVIGAISMGGFGAFDIALHHPGMFCAVGGHSPALWFEGGETAPGAFDDAADFEANDVVGTVQEDPEAFGDAHVWIDYGVPGLRRRLRRSDGSGRRRLHRPLMARRPRGRLLERALA